MFLASSKGIFEVEVLEKLEGSILKVQYIESGAIRDVHAHNLVETTQEGMLVQREIRMKKDFKNSHKNKRGEHKCAWCGKRGKDLTVDHIDSLDSFGGRKAIRKDYRVWKRAWNFDNLQMLCEECNKSKSNFKNEFGDLTLNQIDFHARVLNTNKMLNASFNKGSMYSKVSYGIATSDYSDNKKEFAEYVAKADSNIIRQDIIFGRQEAYDLLPQIG